jgi:hypothetical protein
MSRSLNNYCWRFTSRHIAVHLVTPTTLPGALANSLGLPWSRTARQIREIFLTAADATFSSASLVLLPALNFALFGQLFRVHISWHDRP